MSTTDNQNKTAPETTESGTNLFAGLPEDTATEQKTNTLNVSAPKGASSEAYTVEAGDVIKLSGFNASDATFKVDGNNLIISVEGQPDIYLLDFAKLQGTEAGNQTFIELSEGATVDANSLLAQLTPASATGSDTQVAASDDNINNIEPAAGPAAGAAGGAGFTPPPVANDSFSANTVKAEVIGDFLVDAQFAGADERLLETPNRAPNLVDDNGTDNADDAHTIKEDAVPNTITGNVLANDTDPDGDVLTVVNPGTYTLNYGTLTINPDGSYTYTLDNSNPTVDGLDDGDTLTETFRYRASDRQLQDIASLNIRILGTNDGPELKNDVDPNDNSLSIKEDAVPNFTSGNVLDNDVDPDGDVLTVVNPGTYTLNYGTLIINADGTYTYTLDNSNPTVDALDDGDTLTDSFTYEATDGDLNDTAILTITIHGTNDAPTLADDVNSIHEDAVPNTVTGNVLSNDTDVEGDALTVANPGIYVLNYGTLTLNADGTYSYALDNSNPAVNSLKDGDSIQESFVYRASDGTDSSTANLTITIHGTNDGPVANDDAAATDEDTPITISNADILSNDFDVDGDIIRVTGVTLLTGQGTAVLNPDGSVTFNPAPNFHGPVELEYTIEDEHGLTDTAIIRVTVKPVNDGPKANDDAFTTAEDTAITMTANQILANDTDPENDPLSITNVIVVSGGGSAVLNPDGSVTYTPAADYNGPVVLEYIMTDGTASDSAFINITVTPVNDAPIAVDDSFTTAEDTAITIPGSNILANDSDPDGDTLTITAVSVLSGGGTAVLNPDGSVTYTPVADYHGPVVLEYSISDGNGGTDTARINITVTPENDPDAIDDFATTPEDTAVIIPNATILANDVDDMGLTLTITGVRVVSGGGSVQLLPNGDVSYTPAPGYNGPAVLEYTITDPDGNTDSANIFIAVTPVNDAPTAVDDVASMNEDTVLVIPEGTLLANDSDPDGDPLNVTHVRVVSGGGVATIDAAGNVTYVPATNYNGPVVLEYTIDDGNGGTDTALVNITVHPVNDAPDARNDNYTVNEDSSVALNLLANDTDVDGDTLNITHINGVALTGNAQTIDVGNGRVVISAAGAMRFHPDSNWNGTETFNYAISDGNGGTDTATVRVVVRPVNDGPDARDDAYTTDQDTAVNLNLLANDTDIDGDTLSITHINGVALTGNAQTIDVGNGRVVITAAGAMSFQPDNGWNGTETFTYRITDGNGGTDTATARVVVNKVNSGPDARNDSYTVNEDSSVALNLLANDTDADGDTLRITHINGVRLTGSAQNIDVGHGIVAIASNGSMRFHPDNNWNGTETFHYDITDGNGGTDRANVTVRVRPVNDGPNARNDSYTVNEDSNVTLRLLSNDTDPDGDTLSITHINGVRLTGNAQTIDVGHGRVIIESNGTMTFRPDSNWNGTETFQYDISDGNGGTDRANVTVRVKPVNDAPDARNDSFTTNEDQNVLLFGGYELLKNDTDPDGDTLTITHINGVRLTGSAQTIDVGHGKVVIGSDGSMQFHPDRNWNGTETFGYRISDGNGGTDSATVTVKVKPVNDGPDARNDSVSVNENQSIAISVLNNDTDPEGDALSITRIVSGPDFGSAYISGGRIIYTAGNVSSNRTVTFRYEITDGNGGTDIATVTINVRNVNTGGGGDGGGGGDCPLIIDLDGDGLELVALEDSNAMFDVDGDGQAEHTAWASSDDGILAMDWNGDGVINDVTELFGNSLQDGFTELTQLDSNNDGVIDENDDLFSRLQVWQDYNGDGISDDGELTYLSDHGITSIGSVGTENPMVINGQTITHTSVVEYADGTTRDIYSVWFQNQDVSANEHDFTEVDLTGDSLVGFSVSLDDVLSTEENTLVISGDDGDAISTVDFTERGADVELDGQTYASFTNGASAATILVELGLSVNGDVITDAV